MGYTGYENLTEEELIVKLDKAKQAIYNIEREQRHRKEAAEKEKYSNIIGKYFQSKATCSIYKVIKVDDDGKYVCKGVRYTHEPLMMIPYYRDRGFTFWDETKIESFDDMEPIPKEEVDKTINKWKENCINFTF